MTWSGRYLSRLLGRNPGRSLLSLGLAALLAFAFGLVTVLRGIYAELYQNVEVQGVFTGISYTRAKKTAGSGYVRDPYYEYIAQDGMVELNDQIHAPVIFTNRLDELVRYPVRWAEGWDEETALGSDQAVCVLYAGYAAELGKTLGDRLRINEQDWLYYLSQNGDPFEPGETVEELRDRRRPFVTIVGLIQGEQTDYSIFVPVGANQRLSCLCPGTFYLDIARYTLEDYHQASEFTAYAGGILEGQRTDARFAIDTANADRIYEMHRLLETLYPITVAAALLLGGVLPGLTVLYASREISVLRALGAKIRKCVGIYTLGQALCALSGLFLGFALVILIRKPEFAAVGRSFGLYLAAHLAACAIGSGIFAWLCARKHVLAQLQAKE